METRETAAEVILELGKGIMDMGRDASRLFELGIRASKGKTLTEAEVVEVHHLLEAVETPLEAMAASVRLFTRDSENSAVLDSLSLPS